MCFLNYILLIITFNITGIVVLRALRNDAFVSKRIFQLKNYPHLLPISLTIIKEPHWILTIVDCVSSSMYISSGVLLGDTSH